MKRIVLSVAAVGVLLYGAQPNARFDAGLVNPDGTPRQAFSVFIKNARTHR